MKLYLNREMRGSISKPLHNLTPHFPNRILINVLVGVKNGR